MFDLPLRITAIDNVGNYSKHSEAYRARALTELEILYSQMKFQSLDQGQRIVNIGDNVLIRCYIAFKGAHAIITVGASGEESLQEKTCFCTAYGILTGRIMSLKDEKTEPSSVKDHYKDDFSYRADIRVCQKTGLGVPKRISHYEVINAAGAIKTNLKSTWGVEFYISDTIYDVPFTDRFKHEPGEIILVMAMPLVDFKPLEEDIKLYGGEYVEKEGSWSPEVNRRRIVSGTLSKEGAETRAQISSKYDRSTGQTNLLMLDQDIWKENKKFCPFRILPLTLDSCFTF